MRIPGHSGHPFRSNHLYGSSSVTLDLSMDFQQKVGNSSPQIILYSLHFSMEFLEKSLSDFAFFQT